MVTLDVAPADKACARAEVNLVRCIGIGMGIGALAGAALWMLIVVVALAGSGAPMGPMLAVGAGCGVMAGIFLGGWAGTLVGSGMLEDAEHATLRHDSVKD
jgi:hypothetical protein